MSIAVEAPEQGATVEIASEESERQVGLVTRGMSSVIDAVLLNLAAIMAGVGVALVLSVFPLAKNLRPVFEVIAGGAYVLWFAVYFVVFWSATGQTPGARVMQIRLVSSRRERVSVGRAVVRWIAMNLAALPLFAGFVPILFGRRGLPDWLARTLVLDAPQRSPALARREARRAAREGANRALARSGSS